MVSPLVFASIPLNNPDFVDPLTSTSYFQNERILSTSNFQDFNHFTSQPYISNGYIGSRITNLGFGFSYDQNYNKSSADLDNGWPLFSKRYAGAFVAGFFDIQPDTPGTNFPEVLDDGGYESVISSIPQWTDLAFDAVVDNKSYHLHPSDMKNRGSVSKYSQTLDMAHGLVITSYDWLNAIHLEITALAHRSIPSAGALKIEITTNSKLQSLKYTDILDFNTSHRCWLQSLGMDDSAIYMTVNPENIPTKQASIYSKSIISNGLISNKTHTTNQSISVEYGIDPTVDKITILKYVGVASDDLLGTNNSYAIPLTSKKTIEHVQKNPWNNLLATHMNAWNDLWGDSRITVEKCSLLTLSAEASLYHLLANTRAGNTNLTSALGVSGLSSDSYGGMVFWDSDFWMLPSIQTFAPENAVSVLKYRKYIHPQAIRNAQRYGYNGSLYSWTSGRFGNCTGTGPCVDYEYHINVAICYSIWKMYLSGSIDDQILHEDGWPILKDTATFFAQYTKYNQTLGKYTTHNLTDPDEFANFKNNAAYTAIGIAQVMKWTVLVANLFDEPIDPIWKDIRDNMYLATENQITLEYEGMSPNVSIKQADVALISYIDDQDGFLSNEYDYNKERAYRDLVYYASRQSAEGPAMTYPIYLAVTQKVSDIGCGYYTYLRQSIDPFIRFPFAQISEQNNDDYETNGHTHPAFPFLTGHAGIIQSYYFGLLGLRYTYKVGVNDTIHRLLHFDPIYLSRFDGNLTIEGIHYLGEELDIEIDSSMCWSKDKDTKDNHGCSATVNSKGIRKEPIEIYVDSRNPETGLHEVESGGSLVLPLFIPHENMANSLSECKSRVYSEDEGFAGSILDAIIDGDNNTVWQAIDKRISTKIMIDMKDNTTFSKGIVVWGDRPGLNVSLYVPHDPQSMTMMTTESAAILDQKVTASSPYKEMEFDVHMKDRNVTELNFHHNYTARYVVLQVDGVLDEDDIVEGAKIAEFSLFK